MIGIQTPKESAVRTRTVRAGGRELFVAETGRGAAVVLLHGGGPGATGLSNYSRNIDALAQRFRVIVLDLPGYGRSSKGVDGTGYHAAVVLGTRTRAEVDDVIASPDVTAAIKDQHMTCTAVHAFAVERTVPVIRTSPESQK